MTIIIQSLVQLPFKILIALICVKMICAKPSQVQSSASSADLVYRPKLHFSPSSGWMNDPNGLIYYDNRYHLFYQYDPSHNTPKNISWGHAISNDLLHWTQLPIALKPDSLGQIFSGSAIVDSNNVTGLKTESTEGDLLVLLYTNSGGKNGNKQQISLAYSNDGGMSFQKFAGNPVISNNKLEDFRDPKITSYRNGYIVSIAAGSSIRFYESKNLISWTYLSSFAASSPKENDGVWECPDLISFSEVDPSLYVLLVSTNPGGSNGGSGTRYYVGHFDGQHFRSLYPDQPIYWLDYGPDNYAGITFANVQQPLLMAWMSNWIYGDQVPTKHWRGQMTISRSLSLTKMNGRYVLLNQPYEQLAADSIISYSESSDYVEIGADTRMIMMDILMINDQSEMQLVFTHNGSIKSDHLKIRISSKKITIDRSKSSRKHAIGHNSQFNRQIRGQRISDTKLIPTTILLDSSSIELFLDNGATTFTVLSFPSAPYNKILIRPLFATALNIKTLASKI